MRLRNSACDVARMSEAVSVSVSKSMSVPGPESQLEVAVQVRISTPYVCLSSFRGRDTVAFSS